MKFLRPFLMICGVLGMVQPACALESGASLQEKKTERKGTREPVANRPSESTRSLAPGASAQDRSTPSRRVDRSTGIPTPSTAVGVGSTKPWPMTGHCGPMRTCFSSTRLA